MGHGPSYLRCTLSDLDREGTDGATQKIIVSDGPFEEDPKATRFSTGIGKEWDVVSMKGPSGSLLAVWRVFELTLRAGFDRILLFEDDIEPCRNAVTRMLQTSVPDDVAFVAFFDMNDFEPTNPPPPGLHRVPPSGIKGQGFRGHQATLVPRRTLECFCTKMPAHHISETTLSSRSHSDLTMGTLCEQSPWPRYAKHMPCLVEHVGDVSRIRTKAPLRRASQYHGRQFDALTLPVFS